MKISKLKAEARFAFRLRASLAGVLALLIPSPQFQSTVIGVLEWGATKCSVRLWSAHEYFRSWFFVDDTL